MKIKEIEISKLKELKEKSKMLKDERQKGKLVTFILSCLLREMKD